MTLLFAAPKRYPPSELWSRRLPASSSRSLPEPSSSWRYSWAIPLGRLVHDQRTADFDGRRRRRDLGTMPELQVPGDGYDQYALDDIEQIRPGRADALGHRGRGRRTIGFRRPRVHHATRNEGRPRLLLGQPVRGGRNRRDVVADERLDRGRPGKVDPETNPGRRGRRPVDQEIPEDVRASRERDGEIGYGRPRHPRDGMRTAEPLHDRDAERLQIGHQRHERERLRDAQV